eukprot:TRINITY_DN700_c0_g1_i4.p1 TRINITY_DN700_c0_g1~~TRINITY_DN700_c0_g1_i4.p1  ORF type:complete len:140 (-),score=34.14 TRINITY_DN700_c0_g1_i4:42-461(-)
MTSYEIVIESKKKTSKPPTPLRKEEDDVTTEIVLSQRQSRPRLNVSNEVVSKTSDTASEKAKEKPPKTVAPTAVVLETENVKTAPPKAVASTTTENVKTAPPKAVVSTTTENVKTAPPKEGLGWVIQIPSPVGNFVFNF